jgi:hypothetical protein
MSSHDMSVGKIPFSVTALLPFPEFPLGVEIS